MLSSFVALPALSALRAADQQLKLIVNPNVLPVRKELAREIALLDALEKIDVNGIALRLGWLQSGSTHQYVLYIVLATALLVAWKLG